MKPITTEQKAALLKLAKDAKDLKNLYAVSFWELDEKLDYTANYFRLLEVTYQWYRKDIINVYENEVEIQMGPFGVLRFQVPKFPSFQNPRFVAEKVLGVDLHVSKEAIKYGEYRVKGDFKELLKTLDMLAHFAQIERQIEAVQGRNTKEN